MTSAAGTAPLGPFGPIAGARSRTCEVDGLATHWLEGGAEDAPPVVLLHDGAFGGSAAATWPLLIGALAGRHRVLAPDLLGYGESEKVHFFTRDNRAQRITHVARWLATLGVGSASFVGNSFGASLVLHGAAAGTLPVARGVAICGTGGPHMIRERFEDLTEYAPSEAAMRRIVARFVPETYAGYADLARFRYEASLAPGHWEALNATRLRRPDAPDRPSDGHARFLDALAGVSAPFLFVTGGDDTLLEPGWADDLGGRMRAATVVDVEGARHQPHLDHGEVSRLIADFLAGAPVGRAPLTTRQRSAASAPAPR